MKRLLLAGIVLASFAFSRAGARAESDDAYGSLIGMADSAAGDKGPQAGEIPPDNDAMPERRRPNSPAYASGAAEAATPSSIKPAKAKREAVKADEAPSVSVPPPAPRRAWTSLFASLLPQPAREPSFEVAVSTAPRRAHALRDTPASIAGAAQGMLELVAAATAPYGAEVSLPHRR